MNAVAKAADRGSEARAGEAPVIIFLATADSRVGGVIITHASARRDHDSMLLLDEVVLGGGNANKLTSLPMGCRMGDNANALLGGFRLWEGVKK